jgi:hypothetical protein
MFGLDKDQIAFIESGVSIIVASRDSQNRPFEGRSAGCRAAPDGSAVTVFLSRLKYPLLLDAIRRSGVVAVSFSEPSSNRSLQLKSTTAEMVELRDGDAESVATHLELFAADLDRIGHLGNLGRTVLASSLTELAAVRFTPLEAFTQTPGPVAGKRIGA